MSKKFKKKYNNNTLKNDIYAFLTTESKDKIDQIFNNIQTSEDDAADWVTFTSYLQKWVIISLNKCMSKIDDATSPDNTNVAEATAQHTP
ncbi:hypothetical protein C1646_759966 [Rhizophagus diaphanus]|nr:hypothetical protein C1646_759966 [Rhizophagus diaphanus] [Rhizophagus sp. MUCL 43196]